MYTKKNQMHTMSKHYHNGAGLKLVNVQDFPQNNHSSGSQQWSNYQANPSLSMPNTPTTTGTMDTLVCHIIIIITI